MSKLYDELNAPDGGEHGVGGYDGKVPGFSGKPGINICGVAGGKATGDSATSLDPTIKPKSGWGAAGTFAHEMAHAKQCKDSKDKEPKMGWKEWEDAAAAMERELMDECAAKGKDCNTQCPRLKQIKKKSFGL